MTTNSSEARESLAPRLREDQQAGGSGSVVSLAQGSDAPQRPAPKLAARAVVTEQKTVLLVVDCPHCGKIHIHAGGQVEKVILGERRARCIGTPTDELRYDIQVVTVR